MNRTIIGLAVMAAALGATVVRADDFHDCGPQPTYAPRGQAWNQGQYQLQATQVWVPGQTQQVWVPGQCYQGRHGFQRCTPGSYTTVVSAGHYETRQDWVWVAHTYQPRQPQYGQYRENGYGRYGQYGRQGRSGRHHGAVPIGY